jgi:hypothetical protein
MAIRKMDVKINHGFKIIVEDNYMGLNKKEADVLARYIRINRGYGNEAWDNLIKAHFRGLLLAPLQTSGFDLVHNKYGKIEVKTFTSATSNKSKIGSNFKPSCLKGTGRGNGLTPGDRHIKSSEHVKKSKYHCFVDITDYPIVFVRFIRSTKLLLKYPNYRIPQKDRKNFMLIK